MSEKVEVEIIRVPNRHDRKMEFLSKSAEHANQIAKERNARTKANRERYAHKSKQP
jgi:uncharacterized membrane protein